MELSTIYEQLLDLPSLCVSQVQVEANRIQIECHTNTVGQRCPTCRQPTSTVNQYYTRTIRDLNLGIRQVYLVVTIRQLFCQSCPRYFSESLDFADLGKEHTHRQAEYMFALARKQSYTEVAALVDSSPKTVERVVLAHCAQVIDLPARYGRVRRLGIDEHSHRKGKKDFLCILTDLDRGTLLDVLPNRKKETLIAHFQSLGKAFCNQITDVACDYWDAYLSTAQTCFPQATLVLDRFHVVKWLNESMDTFRKQLRKSDQDNPHYKTLKWVLYKQYHTLSDKQLDDLDLAFIDSPALKEVYWAREAFHHILDNSVGVETALNRMQKWTDDLAHKGITAFDNFVKTLSKTKEYIANYVINYVSNAVTEGLNNLIRSVRRTAFGMTNFEHLRLRVLAISE